MTKAYGKELILDLHGCDAATFTRESIIIFFDFLCKRIGMEPCDLHFWDYVGYPEAYAEAPAHLKGISAIQFISTSNITIHTLDEIGKVFLNVFSCSEFKSATVMLIAEKHFGGKIVYRTEVKRI